ERFDASAHRRPAALRAVFRQDDQWRAVPASGHISGAARRLKGLTRPQTPNRSTTAGVGGSRPGTLSPRDHRSLPSSHGLAPRPPRRPLPPEQPTRSAGSACPAPVTLAAELFKI